MKKYLAIAVIFYSFASNSNAEDIKKKSYLGIGYQLNSISYNNGSIDVLNGKFTYDRSNYFAKNFHNVNFFAGYKIFEDKDLEGSVDLEVSYLLKKTLNKNNDHSGLYSSSSGNEGSTRSESSLSIVNLDAIFNYEINEYFTILTIGGVAGVFYKYNIDLIDNGVVDGSDQDKQNGIGFNAGIGSEVKIIKDVSARGTVKYTTVTGIDAFDKFMTYGIGIKYNF